MFETFQKKVQSDSKKSHVVTGFISCAPRDNNGNFVLLPVDQFSGKSFLRNACGFPMNDILAFETVQSDQLARAVIHRTQILDLPKNQEMSDADVFAQIVPANWSSPAEFVRASQKYAEYAYSKRMEAERVAAAQRQQQEDSKKPENVVKVDPE